MGATGGGEPPRAVRAGFQAAHRAGAAARVGSPDGQSSRPTAMPHEWGDTGGRASGGHGMGLEWEWVLDC